MSALRLPVPGLPLRSLVPKVYQDVRFPWAMCRAAVQGGRLRRKLVPALLLETMPFIARLTTRAPMTLAPMTPMTRVRTLVRRTAPLQGNLLRTAKKDTCHVVNVTCMRAMSICFHIGNICRIANVAFRPAANANSIGNLSSGLPRKSSGRRLLAIT